MIKRILVPLDFSESSLRALDYALELRRDYDSELIVLHVVETIHYAGTGQAHGPVYDTASLLREFAQAGRQRLDALAARLEKKGVRVRTVLQVGTPHDVIVGAAKRLKVDLIVLSTHGRTGLAHVLMGSVAEKVVRHAACAVLTVRGLEAKARQSSTRSNARSRRVAARPLRAVTAVKSAPSGR